MICPGVARLVPGDFNRFRDPGLARPPRGLGDRIESTKGQERSQQSRARSQSCPPLCETFVGSLCCRGSLAASPLEGPAIQSQ
ncbi:hypothetical protein K523DRAFT_40003 [Schizophyllum commune Tattone D]|nr:hypothetical protein K523DRAFT_40003 [Schizophyllum commune Tattone D]